MSDLDDMNYMEEMSDVVEMSDMDETEISHDHYEEINEIDYLATKQNVVKKRKLEFIKNEVFNTNNCSSSKDDNEDDVNIEELDIARLFSAIDNLQILMTQMVSKTDELYEDVREIKYKQNVMLEQIGCTSPSTKGNLTFFEQHIRDRGLSKKISTQNQTNKFIKPSSDNKNNTKNCANEMPVSTPIEHSSVSGPQANSLLLMKSVLREVKILREEVYQNRCQCQQSSAPPVLERMIKEQRLIMPATSTEEFNNLEKEVLEDSAKLSLFVSRLRSLDGTTHEKYVRECLRQMITDEAASFFSWHGQRDNIAIKRYTIINILKEESYSRYPNIKKSYIEDQIKKWFQYAKDRVNKKKNRVSSSLNPKFEAIPGQQLIMPATSAEEFFSLERIVNEDSDQLSIFTDELRSLNATILEKYVRSCLRKMLTDEAASFFSWFGHRDNIAVKTFTSISILKAEALRKFEEAEGNEVEDIMKKWFQYAKDRNNKKNQHKVTSVSYTKK